MAKLTGAAKQKFLARMNKGRRKAGLKAIGSKTKRAVKKVRSKVKRSSLSRTKRSRSPVARQKTKSRSRRSSRNDIMKYGKKAGIGAGVGMVIRLGTMFFKDQKIRELGARGAAVGATTFGGGTTGELAYQVADAAVSRAIATLGVGGNGGSVSIPNPLVGAA